MGREAWVGSCFRPPQGLRVAAEETRKREEFGLIGRGLAYEQLRAKTGLMSLGS
jgi:hypothetical protein